MKWLINFENGTNNALVEFMAHMHLYENLLQEDVPATYASTDLLHEAVGFKPETSIEEGLKRFTEWYVGFYGIM